MKKQENMTHIKEKKNQPTEADPIRVREPRNLLNIGKQPEQVSPGDNHKQKSAELQRG